MKVVNFTQFQERVKNYEGSERELYRVTEYSESMECSTSKELTDLAVRLNDLSIKINSSLTDKFPKFSVASLNISESSYQNTYDLYKKSYLDYIEPLDIVSYSSPERTENQVALNDIKRSPIAITTNAITLNDTNPFGSIIDHKVEYCSCTKCAVF